MRDLIPEPTQIESFTAPEEVSILVLVDEGFNFCICMNTFPSYFSLLVSILVLVDEGFNFPYILHIDVYYRYTVYQSLF